MDSEGLLGGVSGIGDVVEFGSSEGIGGGKAVGATVGISIFPSTQSIRTLDFRSHGRPRMTSSSPMSVIRKSNHCVLSSMVKPSLAKWVILPVWFRVPSMLYTFIGVWRGKVRIRFFFDVFFADKERSCSTVNHGCNVCCLVLSSQCGSNSEMG